MSKTFSVVASVDEIPEDGQLRVVIDDTEILICHHAQRFYALAYYCSHENLPLEDGMLENGCIICPYHGAEFCLKDGSVQASPAYENLKTYPLKIIKNTIAISISN